MKTNICYQGDCLDVLPTLPDNSVDSIVTDPPYELGFMGKSWDNSGIAYNVDMWKECLRVLKPGGHLLSFSGTRTYHRMAVAIEDAGFEIRDMIEWVYGQGFPKSLNIGKAVDKKPKADSVKDWKKWLDIQINNSGKSKQQINDECGFTATSYVKTDNKDYWSSNLPKNGKWRIMKKVIGIKTDEYDWVEQDNCGERGYVEPTGGLAGGSGNTVGCFTGKQLSNNAIDDRAKQWEGWGTALKPSHEPVVFCSKPLTPRLYFAILIGDISNNIIQLCQISNVKDAEKIFSGIQAKLEKEGVLSVADNVRINAWESLENVKFAEKSFTSKEQKSSDLTKTKENSAQLNAKQNGKKDNLQEIKTLAGVEANIKALMDIIIFGTTENTSQNIALLWNSISEELLNQANTLTISMATRLITDLKILKLSATQSILESTGSLFKTPQNIPPNHEPICMARKPLAEKTLAENVLKYGTGGINIDESRVETEEQLGRQQYSKTSALKCSNYEDKFFEGNVNGRFPANLIHDNSEEVRECFPETKSSKGSFKAEDYEEHETSTNFTRGDFKGRGDSGNASRFFKSIIYTAKASKSERNKGMDSLEAKPMYKGDGSAQSLEIFGLTDGGKEDRKNNHPTVKPVALMEYLIKMITPKGGIVLDPFAGSGSTLVAAKQNGYQYIGIELTEEYIPIINARLTQDTNPKE